MKWMSLMECEPSNATNIQIEQWRNLKPAFICVAISSYNGLISLRYSCCCPVDYQLTDMYSWESKQDNFTLAFLCHSLRWNVSLTWNASRYQAVQLNENCMILHIRKFLSFWFKVLAASRIILIISLELWLMSSSFWTLSNYLQECHCHFVC